MEGPEDDAVRRQYEPDSPDDAEGDSDSWVVGLDVKARRREASDSANYDGMRRRRPPRLPDAEEQRLLRERPIPPRNLSDDTQGSYRTDRQDPTVVRASSASVGAYDGAQLDINVFRRKLREPRHESFRIVVVQCGEGGGTAHRRRTGPAGATGSSERVVQCAGNAGPSTARHDAAGGGRQRDDMALEAHP